MPLIVKRNSQNSIFDIRKIILVDYLIMITSISSPKHHYSHKSLLFNSVILLYHSFTHYLYSDQKYSKNLYYFHINYVPFLIV